MGQRAGGKVQEGGKKEGQLGSLAFHLKRHVSGFQAALFTHRLHGQEGWLTWRLTFIEISLCRLATALSLDFLDFSSVTLAWKTFNLKYCFFSIHDHSIFLRHSSRSLETSSPISVYLGSIYRFL
jgi:hypothetical protein